MQQIGSYRTFIIALAISIRLTSGQSVKEQGVSIPTYLDIQAARVTEGSGDLNDILEREITFHIKLAGQIPKLPRNDLTFGFLLDADLNSQTGSSDPTAFNDLGVDVKLAIRFKQGNWLGPGRWVLEGDSLRFTLPVRDLTPSFRWIVFAMEGSRYLKLPAQGHGLFAIRELSLP